MKIAVLSDSHDHIWNLRHVLTVLPDYEIEMLFFLGDFCAPFTLKQLAEGFSGPIHVVFGNNDGDLFRITNIASGFSHVTLHGELAEVEIDGKLIALNHFPELATPLAHSGKYDAVFFGHNHLPSQETLANGTVLGNPGAIMGGFDTSPSFGIYDSQTHAFATIPFKQH